MTTGAVTLFELELPLPDSRLASLASRLVGFERRYERIRRDLRLLADPQAVRDWSSKHYGRELPLCTAIADRYPLIIFGGDVGTGKTATAEAAADRLARETGKDAMLFKLSTRVRGSGKVGEMSTLINQAFETVAKEAGKARSTYLIIDEADSLAATRDTAHSHHEDKVAVNTIIQKIDDLRRLGGRVLVFLCTNRAPALDAAVTRRAARIEIFERPTDEEREAVLRMDFEGIGLRDETFRELVKLTGPHHTPFRPGFTYSDLRSRLLPEAIARAFPDRQILDEDVLLAAAGIEPSPSVSITDGMQS
jgi:SpoVK/Ycf46/Vps4 family AAA+-type ATPase